ncbi:protein of unknown function [Methylococcus capsulatus]|jgi:hypothetical protein|uniref:Uncharacterized protein n=1 Tax=Methylococcus capsulatus TaxID=414 RepID=A0AA35ULG6_METCP|nr:protein of unknown function [Methylococcus capsulatus]
MSSTRVPGEQAYASVTPVPSTQGTNPSILKTFRPFAMDLLVKLIKILLLLFCAALAFGWGVCGILGLAAVGNPNGGLSWEILPLALAGFALMALFGWFAWKLKRSLSPTTGRPP